MYSDRKVCLVLLVGIPGSGKSFFRKFIETYFYGNSESVLGYVQVWSVCYDNCEHMKRWPISNWKQCRLDILKLVDNLVEDLKSQKSHSKNVVIEKFGISVINKELESPDSTVIVIDDNMYYRSMRYEYYKLARDHNVSFSQIFFEVDLLKALKCNSERSADSRVPESVIEKIYKKLESPQTNHSWEKFSVSVSSYANFQNHDVLNKIFRCLRSALDNPVTVIAASLNEEKTLEIPRSNALHQIDNILKQLVSEHIKSHVSVSTKSDLNITSKVYSERRLKLLKFIKKRVITLPMDLNEAVTQEKMNIVKPVLSALLFSD